MHKNFFEIAKCVAVTKSSPECWTHLSLEDLRKVHAYLVFLENKVKKHAELQNNIGYIWSVRTILNHVKLIGQFPIKFSDTCFYSFSDRMTVHNFDIVINQIYCIERNYNQME